MKNNEGITIIALIVTIIVMLILAGVTLSPIIGRNGILNNAKTVAEDPQIEEYKEKINLSRVEILGSDLENITINDFIDKLYEDGILKEDTISDIDDTETYAEVVTPEKYIFRISLDETKYMGIQNEEED